MNMTLLYDFLRSSSLLILQKLFHTFPTLDQTAQKTRSFINSEGCQALKYIALIRTFTLAFLLKLDDICCLNIWYYCFFPMLFLGRRIRPSRGFIYLTVIAERLQK